MDRQKPKENNSLPFLTSNYQFNLLAMGLFFAELFLLNHYFPQMDRVLLASLSLFSMLFVLICHDLIYEKVHKRASTGLMEKAGPRDVRRLMIKLTGLYGTLLIVLVLYYLNPFYRDSALSIKFYNSFFIFLKYASPWILALSFLYFWYIDPRQKDPYDEYWHMGCLLNGRFKDVNGIVLQEHARVWFIKGFFTPFMFALLVSYIDIFLAYRWAEVLFSPVECFLIAFYMIDVVYGVLGYILTLRLLDNHIRSTDPTFLGWMTCLMAYSPFYLIGLGLFPYDDGLNWNHWFSSNTALYCLFGGLVVFLSLVYALATVAFGYRMSNLTYRGIITAGPYRFTKHPAYFCKVASWWLITLPFLSVNDPKIALQYTLNLIFVSFIYYLRALTEENHLSNYPEYVDYATRMNKRGVLRFLTKYFPAFQYSEERCRRWGSVVWFKKIK